MPCCGFPQSFNYCTDKKVSVRTSKHSKLHRLISTIILQQGKTLFNTHESNDNMDVNKDSLLGLCLCIDHVCK